MYVTEAELREWWQNGRGNLPAFPEGTRFSPAARDFLAAHGIAILLAASPAQAKLPTPDPQPVAPLPRLNSLHASLLLAAAHARRFRLPELAARLAALTEECLAITQAGYKVGPPAPGRRIEEPPGPEAHEMRVWLYFVRAQAREAEAQTAQPGLAIALDRLASAVYDLELQFQSGALTWKLPGET